MKEANESGSRHVTTIRAMGTVVSAILLLLAAPVFSQENSDVTWSILQPVGNSEEIVDTINEEIALGLAPVGLELDVNGRIFLLLTDEYPDFQNWVIHEFADLSSFEEEFSNFLGAGWLPEDIVVRDERIVALFLQRDVEAMGWTILSSDLTDEEVEIARTALEEAGYFVTGTSTHNNRAWLLGVEFEGQPSGELELSVHTRLDEQLQADINQRRVDGWQLRSLARSDQDGVIIHWTRYSSEM